MNATLRRRLERAVRVRDFIRAHRTDGAGEATALTRLEELIQRADALATQQRAGVVATRAATVQREELRHALQSKLLIYLAAVGAVAAKGNTELAPQFQLPRAGASNQAWPRRDRRRRGRDRMRSSPRREGGGAVGGLITCRAFLAVVGW